MEKLCVAPTVKWCRQLPKSAQQKGCPTDDSVSSMKAEAQNALDSETRLYHRLKENKRDNDFAWISKILRAGTLSDKVSAHTLLIQDSQVYNISSLEALIAMVTTKGKRECLMAMDALQGLFIGELLVDDRKLKHFNEQPLDKLPEISQKNPTTRTQLLVLWLFEDILKTLYKKFLQNLDAISHDTIEKTKVKAVSVMAVLLKDNPEQEQFLLEKLVNKIGDPVAKVGSHVCYLIGQLLQHHREMKGIVVGEVERLLFRPNLAERAKYYALCFLNQIILSHEESSLANHLITIYFAQFKHFVGKGEVNTKIMSALLTGVARGYPYAKLKDDVVMSQLDAMYKLVHIVSFNISIQALMLIFQVLDSRESISDRFYGALYRKLLDPALASSSRQALVLNLVYKALKKDVALVRIKTFVKRLLQVALYQSPNLQCGILVLISEVNRLHPNLMETKRMFQEDSDSEEHYSDVPDEDDTDKTVLNTSIKKETSNTSSQRSQPKKKSVYDFDCRNPLHSNADCQHLWELLILRNSFHPSVSLFASQVSKSTPIKYSGDPLTDFTTARFLDRFVYRNPKAPSENFKTNPKSKVFGSRKLKAVSNQLVTPNSEQFLQQRVDKIPAQERFIYDYLQKRSHVPRSGDKDSDMDSVCSEDFQKLIDGIHPEDNGDFLDFSKELKTSKRKRQDEIESEDDIADLDDEEIHFDGGSDLEDFEFEDGENDIDNMEIDEDDFISEESVMKKKSKKDKSLANDRLLASAEEFSSLLEDNANGKMDTVTANAFKVKDKSGAKQIAWEIERNRQIKGRKWQSKKKKYGKKIFKKS